MPNYYADILKQLEALQARVDALEAQVGVPPVTPPPATAAIIPQTNVIAAPFSMVLQGAHGFDEAGRPRWRDMQGSPGGKLKVATTE